MKSSSLVLMAFLFSFSCMAQGLYDFTLKDSRGKDIPLKNYSGKPVLLVNIATRCGFTKQLDGLEKLNQTYRDRGLVVLGVPSNDFLSQTPEDDPEVENFCRLKYGVTFTVFAKIKVVGDGVDPLFAYIRSKKNGSKVKWNFEKFLFDKTGQLTDSFSSFTGPDDEGLKKAIEKVL